jgi:3-isopropylmalate/(R)-2-methylmalate dehydratase large subunit
MELDAAALGFIERTAQVKVEPLASDRGAAFADEVTLELAQVEPMVALPGSSTAEHMASISEVLGTAVQRGYIGSCSSGRFEDLEAAAAVLDGRHIAPGFQLIIVPTSQTIRERAEREGVIAKLEAAGAHVARSSCDYCFGYAQPLRDEETCISSGVLNVRGRMGSTKADIYLGSARTVAASALEGVIADPRDIGSPVNA